MDESILTSIKKLLGPNEDDTSFDSDITMHINTVFADLNFMGIGPVVPLIITDKTVMWSSFLNGATNLESVKTYIFLRVKMVFDPPQSASVIEVYNQAIKKLEWELYELFNSGEENA